ncbi:hypothetical protein EI42_05862 [Thermosporothrix hazakensis]|jgi:tetratricopeptide (TPR) repeat protein|uniref:Tetratricopeptide repeat protein n=1 Tax=Thermosporothrix hazakensis TaxID=644383 RepID=A0A326TVC0_THEHA|nr:hypothetical protein [Thermosporothrix hazakensis]PZW20716.1 hypothetical protein EI42_05862 [Thermosporothrix hazakensis]GCE49845.1 hypothetical protein KTH_47140 [Thermosporothrix hazakensis]
MDQQSIQQIASYIQQYETQCQQGKQPDIRFLQIAQERIEAALQAESLESNVVHLAVKLHSICKEYEQALLLLRRYKQQALSREEEAWARWEIVDHLALLKRYEETVREQYTLIQWAEQHFPPEKRLWTVTDSTQAGCWFSIGKGDEWIYLFNRILEQTPIIPQTRQERYYALRTGTDIYLTRHNVHKAQAMIASIRELAQEDPQWDQQESVLNEVILLEIKVCAELQQMEDVRALAQQATIEFERQAQETKTVGQGVKKWTNFHNLGAIMYYLRQYDLAIVSLRRALALHSWAEQTYLWLAASLWATGKKQEKERQEVLSLLAQGTAFATGGKAWREFQELPEFQDVRDDPQFLQATQGVVSG